MTPRAWVAFIILAIFAAAVLASFHAKPAEASMIVCHQRAVRDIPAEMKAGKINRT